MCNLVVSESNLLNVCCVVASRAGYVCVPTDRGASRILSFVSLFVVSESSLFVSCIAVFASRAGVGSITILGTGGSGYYRLIAVTELRNCCLRYKNLVTYRTMLTFGKSGFGTGRSLRFVDLFGVSELFDRLLRYKNLVTYRAMLTFGKTGFGTSRSLRFVDHFGVAESIDYRLLYENLVTNATVLTLGKTGFGTSCCNCRVDHFGVTEFINYILFYQNFAADGAFNSRGKSGFGTGCRYCRNNLIGMSLSVNYKRRFIRCALSCFIQEEGAAIFSAALVMLILSLFSTSGCRRLNLFEIMTESVNLFGVGMRLIILTGKGLYAVFGTGRIGGNFTLVPSVTDSSDGLFLNGGFVCTVFILEYLAAVSASVVFVVTGSGAGRCLSVGLGHLVSKSIDLAISGVVALSTILVCVPTLFRTGCSLGCYCCDIVTGFLNGLLRNGGFSCTGFILEYLAASAAGIVFVVAGLCTGRCLRIGLGHLVAKSRLFNVSCVIASRTGYVCIPSDCGTGRCLCFVSNFIVTESIYSLLLYQNLAADGTFSSLGKSGFGTGCIYCGDLLLGVTLSGDHLSSSLLWCPIDYKGCCEGLQTFCCAVSFRCYNGGYLCRRSIIVAIVISTHTRCGAVSIAVGPFIGRLAICVTQCVNIFYVLSPGFCPGFSKGCCVCRPALCFAGSCLFFVRGYSCCCSLNVAVVCVAHTLSGADPDLIRRVVLPIIACVREAMTESIAYGNCLVRAYRITTVALYFVSCRFRTGSFG